MMRIVMTDDQVQKKLDQLMRLANALDREAKKRHGTSGMLFFEADGSFHLMAGDSGGGTCDERQRFIRFSSSGYCTMGAGAW